MKSPATLLSGQMGPFQRYYTHNSAIISRVLLLKRSSKPSPCSHPSHSHPHLTTCPALGMLLMPRYQVREELGRLVRLDFTRSYIKHGYKELCIPALPGGKYSTPAPPANLPLAT